MTAPQIHRLIVPSDWEGQRIDKSLSQIPEISSRTRAENLIQGGHVFVNGQMAKPSTRLKSGDVIDYKIVEKGDDPQLIPRKIDFVVLYEDDDVLVVDKPAGLVVHPAAGHASDTLVNGLLERAQSGLSTFNMKFGEKRPGIVHRLDKDTSGVLVVAKNDFAQENLVQQFKARSVHRIYFAAVNGAFKQGKGTIQSYLARHPVDRKRFASIRDSQKKIIRTQQEDFERGKWAVTHFEVLQATLSAAYLRLKLETGRTHQIRVHLSEMGHAILADPIYGAKTGSEDIVRCALHAAELGFKQPRSGKDLFFETPWPDDLLASLERLGFSLRKKPHAAP